MVRPKEYGINRRFMGLLNNGKISNYLYDIVFILILLSPTTSLFYYIISLVVIACSIHYNGFKTNQQLVTVKISIIIVMFISAIMFSVSGANTFSPVFRMIMLAIMIVTFPFVPNVKLHRNTIYLCTVFVFLTQIAYVIHIPQIISLLEAYYPIESEVGLYSADYLYSAKGAGIGSIFRLGGFMHNPNQCARTYSFIYALLLFDFSKKSYKDIICAIVIFIGVLYTGSRTGFLVLFALSTIHYLINISNNKTGKIVWLIVGIVVLYVIYNYILANAGTDDYRALRVSEGIGDSFAAKIGYFYDYIGNSEDDLIAILFGRFDQHLMENYLTIAESLDSEFGVALFTYGVAGLFLLLLFLAKVINKLKKPYVLFSVVLLWMFSSTLLFSYRTSLVFMFILSICYSNSISNNGK